MTTVHRVFIDANLASLEKDLNKINSICDKIAHLDKCMKLADQRHTELVAYGDSLAAEGFKLFSKLSCATSSEEVVLITSQLKSTSAKLAEVTEVHRSLQKYFAGIIAQTRAARSELLGII